MGDDADEIQLDLDPSAKACGNCRIWRAVAKDSAGGWLGDCRVQPQRGRFAPTAPICGSFLSREREVPQALPEAPERHRARRVGDVGPRVVHHSAPAPRPDVDLGEDFDMTREELKAIFREALGETEAPLAAKWEGGTVILKPRDPSLQAKEIPIDSLFHKVVMVRDRLRVLEQKLNGHEKLSDAEKVEMQQYVTKCYGSLTTFNVLFAEKGDQFVGEKS
ncbi:MAG TPA: hypothetical protein VMB50_00440 [Myxococcales bacterium]|nr:hypothetical protein [Myxococcales bacterium]